MAKPTQDPKWVTTDDPAHIIEPSAGAKLNGITSGGIWAREHLNWMFNANSKWIDWIREHVRSNTENDDRYVQHSEVVDVLTSESTITPLSAKQGKTLNDKFGVAGSQVQTNEENKVEFVSHSEVVNVTEGLHSDTQPFSADIISKMFAGQVSVFAGTNPPEGWLPADGRVLPKEEYPYLWNHAELSGNLSDHDTKTPAQYGEVHLLGETSSVLFSLPDLRGQHLRFWDNGRGIDAGRTIASEQADENKRHTHSATTRDAGEHSHAYEDWAYTTAGGVRHDSNNNFYYSDKSRTTSPAGNHNHTVTVDHSGIGENRVKNVALMVCIKY